MDEERWRVGRDGSGGGMCVGGGWVREGMGEGVG